MRSGRLCGGVCHACRVARGGSRRFTEARSLIGLAGTVAFGIALVAFVVVADTALVVRAYQRSASSTLPAIAGGAAAALATVLAFAWYRSAAARLGRSARRNLGRAGLAWGALFIVATLWTHPLGRDEDAVSAPEVAAVTYVVLLVVAAVAVLPLAVRRL